MRACVRGRPGDRVAFARGGDVRVVRVAALGVRRGPAAEAATLYEDLAPPPSAKSKAAPPRPVPARRDPGAGRPTKTERRATDRLKGH